MITLPRLNNDVFDLNASKNLCYNVGREYFSGKMKVVYPPTEAFG